MIVCIFLLFCCFVFKLCIDYNSYLHHIISSTPPTQLQDVIYFSVVYWNILAIYFLFSSSFLNSISFIIFAIAKIFKYKNMKYAYNIIGKGCTSMIEYSPFWSTLEKSNENWYTLTNKHHISHSTLHRFKHNKDVSTKTLNDLCRILQCNIQDIVQYIPSDTDQPL